MHTVEKRERARAPRLRTITPAPPVEGWAREVATLEEAGTELAVVLWRVLRRVRDWAESPPDDRAGLFEINKKDARERLARAGALAPDLVEAFGTFALLVRAPGTVGAKQLAEACHQVHEWAEERSHVKVAMLFAEEAAAADPEDPAWANVAGMMCRRVACDERAATWYHRGFGLGVRAKDHQEAIRAQIGYGNLMKDLGHHDEARRFFERAAQRAINTGRLRTAGEAFHSLLTVAAEIGAYKPAGRYVRKALELYPVHFFRIPALAHDWAVLLIRMRYYTPAVRLLELALPKFQNPVIQTVVWGNLARAVAGVRQLERFNEAERNVVRLIDLHKEFAPSALNGLAAGKWAFGEWEDAERYARMALDISGIRKDVGESRISQDLLEKLAAREAAPIDAEPSDRESLNALHRRFEARIRRWKAPGHSQPGA